MIYFMLFHSYSSQYINSHENTINFKTTTLLLTSNYAYLPIPSRSLPFRRNYYFLHYHFLLFSYISLMPKQSMIEFYLLMPKQSMVKFYLFRSLLKDITHIFYQEFLFQPKYDTKKIKCWVCLLLIYFSCWIIHDWISSIF